MNEKELQKYKKYTKEANIWFGISIIILVIPMIFGISIPESLVALWLFIGTGIAMWGCSSYAKAKGYSRFWGLLSLFVVLLPKKNT